MKQGKLIISIDFELHWGIFDKVPLTECITYFENTRKVIPKILKLFEKYQIKATWATVGMLFNESLDELLDSFPEKLPTYENPKLSAYNYILKNKDLIRKYPRFYFAPELIKQIADTPGQEIASHTYSHFYCLEKGQTADDFKTDLLLNIQKAKKFDLKIKSLVLPRNQLNTSYYPIAEELGIENIRTNPDIWFWNTKTPESLQKRIARTADCYLPIHKSIYKDFKSNFGIIEKPASRFMRPISKYPLLEKLKIKRIKDEMLTAAKTGKNYHLWWHPHNFGNQPKQSLKELEQILIHYVNLNKIYGYENMNF